MGSRGTALITMELAALILILAAAASGQRHQVDEVLKSEIEQAASESRHLADELAGMLDRLEIEEDRSAAVNAAVLGEQEEVEAALKVMVEKIENLAKASEDSSSETVSGLVKKKRVKEQELRKTLEQLELVASQIEEAADTADSIEEVGVTQLSEQLLDVVLGDLVTEVAEDVVQLSQHHGAVAVLVVQLEELQVVVVGSLRVGGGDSGLALLHDIVVLGELLALLVGLSLGDTGLLGDVQAESVHDVSEEEEVNLAFAIPVVDVADVLDLCLINHLAVCMSFLVTDLQVPGELPMYSALIPKAR